VDDSLSRELCIKILKDWTYRRIYSKERHPHTGARSHSGHADPRLYRNSPNGGVGAASIQYWRWRGQASEDIPGALKGRAPRAWTQRLPILLLSRPAPSKEEAGLVPGVEAVYKDLSRPLRCFS